MMELLKVFYFVCCLICLVPGPLLGSESTSVKILVLGRTGAGKSTLINNILGRKIASVGHKPFPETTTVSAYKEEIHGVSVTACDTPGLGDASGQEEEYMEKIKASCGNPDLVLYCLSMDNIRWHSDDEEAIQLVTKLLGDKIWDHSVLVLTFADKYVANNNPERDIFEERRSDLEMLFKRTLENINIEAANRVHNVVSANDSIRLPGVPDWMGFLMTTCLADTHDNGKEGFRQIMFGRTANPHKEDEVPLEWTDTLCTVMQKNPVAWSASILGYKAGGYLASKYIAAKLGGAIAGPVGFVVGGLTGYTLEYILSYATCPSGDKTEL